MNIPRHCGALALSTLLLAGPLTGQASAVIPGDFDADGDVDLVDFVQFQACALGSAIDQVDPECADARLDADQDVDLEDIAVFQGCFSGAGNPADPDCACPSSQTNCDGTCVDTASDYLNCGACGNYCAAGLCENGACAACGEPGPCFGGQLWCDGVCREVQLNPSHCGCCGHQCGPGQNCAGGLCWDAEPCPGCRVGAVMIPGDFDGDGDVDLTDFAHFQTCALGAAIAQTAAECTDARLDADLDVDLDDFEVFQRCLSGANNPADPNCACPSSWSNCDGTCVNTASDNANCGACGNVCGAGLTCHNGSCASCPGGLTFCNGTCRDLHNDPTFCGTTCENAVVCSQFETCTGGVCEPV